MSVRLECRFITARYETQNSACNSVKRVSITPLRARGTTYGLIKIARDKSRLGQLHVN